MCIPDALDSVLPARGGRHSPRLTHVRACRGWHARVVERSTATSIPAVQYTRICIECAKWRICVINDRCSSTGPTGCATMYQHYHYRGRQLRINNGQVLNNFVRLRFNDQLSGVKVRRGCTLQVFEHVNYRGRRLQFKGRNNCCFRGWWNDKASSAKCVCRSECAGETTHARVQVRCTHAPQW